MGNPTNSKITLYHAKIIIIIIIKDRLFPLVTQIHCISEINVLDKGNNNNNDNKQYYITIKLISMLYF